MSTNRLPSKQHVLAAALRKLLADPTEREQAKAALRQYDADQLGAKRKEQAHEEATMPIVIGTHRFASKSAAFHVAQRAGFNGAEPTFYQRLKKGLPWEEIIAPVNAANSAARKAGHARRKAEMATLLADMPRTAYLSHVFATDGTPGRFDVVALEADGTHLARWPWRLSTCPKARDKECRIDGHTYRIKWETQL